MNISSSSWHYRYAASVVSMHGRRDLCSYIRALVQATIARAVVLPLMVALGYSMFQFIFAFWVGFPKDDGSLHFFQVVFGMISWMLLIIVTLIGGGIALYEKYTSYKWQKVRAQYPDGNVPAREPNVFFQWLADKHSKVCTLVTYD